MAFSFSRDIFQDKPQETQILGVGNVRSDPENVASEYQRRVRQQLDQRQRPLEAQQFEEQRQRITQAMQGTTTASEAARTQAMQAGQAAAGAAHSGFGAGGIQTAALGGFGAGMSQQAGFAGAAEVTAQEQQRNALAQAQLAEMLRQQEMARMAFERSDYTTALGAERAMLMPELELQQDYAAREAERLRRRQAAAVQAGAVGAQALADAYRTEE